MGTTRVTHLLGLPDEIMVVIFGFLDYVDHREAIRVSKRFHGFSEPYLYHNIHVRHSKQALALVNSLKADIRRARFVRHLLVSTKLGEESGVSALPPVIADMCNLQNLRLETPDCNSLKPKDRTNWVKLQDRYERIFGMSSALVPRQEERLLPTLQSCTIHFVDSEKEIYSMTRYSMLFLHPTLKSLTISCASTDFPGLLLKPFQNDPSLQKSTRLEFLHLEECDIFPETLALLLSFPRQLKSLKISEGVRYTDFRSRSSRLHGNVSPASLVYAIAQHCLESLEWLSLSLGHRRHATHIISDVDQHLALSSFLKIKYLEVDSGTVSLLRSQPCDHQTWRRLPPNLESLKVFGIPVTLRLPFRPISNPRLPFRECFIKEKAAHGVPKLQSLIFDFEHYRHEEDLIQRLPNDLGTEQDFNYVDVAISILKKECDRFEPICKKAGVRLQLQSTILPTGFIPPYLFYEEHPIRDTIWQMAP
ncbi:hypothetical protein DV736_g2966, partial [Chaetothyriales sp. CBS 134916]